MITRVPFQHCVAGIECLPQVLMLPTNVIANLCNGLVAGMFLAVAKAEIDVESFDGMLAGIVLPSGNPYLG